MISSEDLKVISTVFGKTSDEISSAISKEEEVSLGLRLNGRVISQEEEKTLKDTIRNAGVEIGFKQLAKELDINLTSEDKEAKIIAEKLKAKTIETLEEKYKNPQPGERETELEQKLASEQAKYEKLFSTHESKLKEIDEWQTKYQTKETEIKTKERNNSILKSLPDKVKYNRDHALIVINNILEAEESDGEVIYKRDGKAITDAVGKPEKLEVIVPSLAEEFGWLKGSGMGGSDRSGQGSAKGGKSPDEAAKIVREKYGDNAASPEGIKLFKELTTTSTSE